MLENCNIIEKELNKDQLIMKLLKRKTECLMSLKQYEKARNCRDNVLKFSKQVDTVSLDGKYSVTNILSFIISNNNLILIYLDQFVKKCKILSDYETNNSIKIENKNVNEPSETLICTEDVIKRILEKNKIILPFKSPKLKLW